MTESKCETCKHLVTITTRSQYIRGCALIPDVYQLARELTLLPAALLQPDRLPLIDDCSHYQPDVDIVEV